MENSGNDLASINVRAAVPNLTVEMLNEVKPACPR